MITIANISPELKSFGVHKYELRINKMLICQFEHKREDGLAACLMAAAKEIEKSKWMNAKHIFFESDLKSWKKKN